MKTIPIFLPKHYREGRPSLLRVRWAVVRNSAGLNVHTELESLETALYSLIRLRTGPHLAVLNGLIL